MSPDIDAKPSIGNCKLRFKVSRIFQFINHSISIIFRADRTFALFIKHEVLTAEPVTAFFLTGLNHRWRTKHRPIQIAVFQLVTDFTHRKCFRLDFIRQSFSHRGTIR